MARAMQPMYPDAAGMAMDSLDYRDLDFSPCGTFAPSIEHILPSNLRLRFGGTAQ